MKKINKINPKVSGKTLAFILLLTLIYGTIIIWLFPLRTVDYAKEISTATPVHTETPIMTVEPTIEPTEEPITTPVESVEDYIIMEPFFPLTNAEYEYTVRVVMGESGGEGYAGNLAVAQCILTTCLEYNINPSQAVGQSGCKIKYDGYYTGDWNKIPDSVKLSVIDCFYRRILYIDEPIKYFYNPDKSVSDWHESLMFMFKEGGHKFFKVKESKEAYDYCKYGKNYIIRTSR